jgi:hypothetical protein
VCGGGPQARRRATWNKDGEHVKKSIVKVRKRNLAEETAFVRAMTDGLEEYLAARAEDVDRRICGAGLEAVAQAAFAALKRHG